jgi:hypothetical protein
MESQRGPMCSKRMGYALPRRKGLDSLFKVPGVNAGLFFYTLGLNPHL